MSNTARLIVALVGAAALAVLSTPELSSKLPPGMPQICAAAVAAVLHKMNADSAKLPPAAEEPK